MKKFILTSAVALIGLISTNANAQTWDCGDNGNNVTATLSGNTLTISGTGHMQDYAYTAYAANTPWYDSRTSIQTVIISDSVKSIGDYSFYKCSNLTSATLPNNLFYIGKSAFSNCTLLTSVNLPYNLSTLEASAFEACGLTSIIIPDSVYYIGNYAFSNCSDLSSVTLGYSVNSMQYGTFGDCTSLISVISLNPTPPTIKSLTFDGINASCCLYVPAEAISDYQTATYWSDFTCIKDLANIVSTEDVFYANISIYPNPFTDALNISEANGGTLCVLNQSGSVLHTQHIKNSIETLRLGHLSAGVYILRLEIDGQVKTWKIVKR